jgi:DNA-binding Lrp family transcriptional regulator
MDELDLKLVNELELQGYQKPATLAPILGVTERTVHRRMTNLVSEGMIKVTAALNPVLSRVSGGAVIGIKVEPKFLRQVIRELANQRTVISLSLSLGSFDMIATAYFDSMDSLSYYTNQELTQIKGIVSFETIILTWPRKYFRFSWQAPHFSRVDGRLVQLQNHVNTDYRSDEIDRKIIRYLMEDGLTRHSVIRSKVGISESTLHKHIQGLLDSEVIKFEVVPNPKIFVNDVWATIGITVRKKSPNSVINAIIDNPAIKMATVSVGRFNIILLVRVPHIDQLGQLIEEQILELDGISSIQTFLHSKIVKQHGVSWLDEFKANGIAADL